MKLKPGMLLKRKKSSLGRFEGAMRFLVVIETIEAFMSPWDTRRSTPAPTTTTGRIGLQISAPCSQVVIYLVRTGKFTRVSEDYLLRNYENEHQE